MTEVATVDLLAPVLNEQTRSVHFFNGRLLTSEDLTDEQLARRRLHQLYGRACGDGIVDGLEVAESKASTKKTPVLSVSAGLAISRHGDPLVLPTDTAVRLVRAPKKRKTTGIPAAFAPCTPPAETVELLDSGLYLLTVCSVESCQGKTPFGGFSTLPAPCNMRYIVDAVQFRLITLNVPAAWLIAPKLLQNRVAYSCFGWEGRTHAATDPFGSGSLPKTLFENLGSELSECDVPLALLHWHKDDGLQFVDMWSVRRMCSRGSLAPMRMSTSDRASTLAEAMRMQFDDQLDRLIRKRVREGGDPAAIRASEFFEQLPPAGFLPLKTGSHSGLDYRTFLSDTTYNDPVYIEAGDVEALLHEASHYPPVRVTRPPRPKKGEEMVWLYYVRENRQTTQHGGAGVERLYVVFANANLPFYGEPRFDRSHFDYSNFV